MPLHAYDCKTCEATFEKLVPVASRTPVTCPTCESTAVTRQLPMPAKPISSPAPSTNCAGTGPPCGAAYCGRR